MCYLDDVLEAQQVSILGGRKNSSGYTCHKSKEHPIQLVREGWRLVASAPVTSPLTHTREEQKDAQKQLLWLQGLAKWKEDRMPGRLIRLCRPQFEEDVSQD